MADGVGFRRSLVNGTGKGTSIARSYLGASTGKMRPQGSMRDGCLKKTTLFASNTVSALLQKLAHE